MKVKLFRSSRSITMSVGVYRAYASWGYSPIPIGYTVYSITPVSNQHTLIASFANRQHALQFLRLISGICKLVNN